MLQKILIISKNASNNNYSELNFLQKTQWMHMSISPKSGAPKIAIFEILKYTGIGKEVHCGAECCQKYHLYQKMLQIKIVQN